MVILARPWENKEVQYKLPELILPSRNSRAIQWFQKGSETFIKSSISGPKYLCLLAQGVKLLESQDPSHNGWAQGCAACAGGGKWPSHSLKFCASARVSFRLTTGYSKEMPSDAWHRTVQTGHEVFTHMWDSPRETLFHAKNWEETWESPAGVTPMLLKRLWLVLEATTASTRLRWETLSP